MINHIVISTRLVRILLVVALLGAIAAGYGLYTAPARTWPMLLLNGFYVTSLALSAAVFLSAQRLTGARWSAGLRRIPEAFMMALPAAAVLMLALFFGREILYPWARSGAFSNAPAIAGKIQYLSSPWVFLRMIGLFFTWIVLARLIRRASLDQDQNPGASMALHRCLTRYAAMFAVVFAVTFSVATIDWILSLEPDWFSTIFAVYLFAGTFVQGIAAVTLATVILKEQGILADVVRESQLRDLGRMIFAFSMFWAYLWICQYLLIWYGNIPSEVTQYVKWTNSQWIGLFLANLIVNWLVPFATLLSLRAKSRPGTLKVISALLLAGHWLDLYVLIMPSLSKAPKFGFLELFLVGGYAALICLLFARNLAVAPLVPVNDPVLLMVAMSQETMESHTWAR